MLYNMLAAIDRIEEHVRSATSPAAVEDGIIFNLVVMGEAASKLPAEFIAQHKHIPWADVVGMRHRLVHAYYNIDMRTVWDTVHNDVPKLKEQLLKLSADMETR